MGRFFPVLLREIADTILILWNGAALHRSLIVNDVTAGTGGERFHIERVPASAPAVNPHEGVWTLLTHVERIHDWCLHRPQIRQELVRARERLRYRSLTRSPIF
jgi:hypothetical protein